MSVIPARPEIGPFLRELVAVQAVDAKVISEEQPLARTPFFMQDPIPPESKFGYLFADSDFQTIKPPNVYQGLLRSAILAGTDGVIIFKGRVLLDTVRHVQFWEPDSLTRELRNDEWIEFRHSLRVNRRLPGIHFCGFAGSWRNYAHWLNESVPRLYAYITEKRLTPSLKLVLPPLSGVQAETVAALGINPEDIVIISGEDVIEFDELYTTSAIDIWTVPAFLRKATQFLADLAIKGVLHEGEGEVIYIHRGSAVRRVNNFNDLKSLLDRFGFEVVDFQGTPLAEQIRRMRAARFVIGEHGAGLVNVLFMKPGGTVLELFNSGCVQPAYWSISSLMEQRFGFLVGDSKGSQDWNADYEVDLQRLETTLKIMFSGHFQSSAETS